MTAADHHPSQYHHADHHPSQYHHAEEVSRQHKTEQVRPPYPYLHKRHQGPSQQRRCERRAKPCVALAAAPVNSTLLHNCGCEVEKAHAQPQPNLIIDPSKHLQSAEEATQDHSTLQAAARAVHAVQSVHQPFDFSTLRQQQVQASGVRAQPLQAAGQAVHAVRPSNH